MLEQNDIAVRFFPVFDEDGSIFVRLENPHERSGSYDLQQLADNIKKTFSARKGYYAKIFETIHSGARIIDTLRTR